MFLNFSYSQPQRSFKKGSYKKKSVGELCIVNRWYKPLDRLANEVSFSYKTLYCQEYTHPANHTFLTSEATHAVLNCWNN